ncbi:MAG: hypothetical protein ACLFQ7_08985 [Phormidium sp.]
MTEFTIVRIVPFFAQARGRRSPFAEPVTLESAIIIPQPTTPLLQ